MALLRALELPPPARRVLDGLLDGVMFYTAKIEAMEKHLRRRLAPDVRVGWLESVPGIGKLTATYLLAEIGQVERFLSAEKLVSYAGLCPSTRASAGRLRHGPTGPAGRRLLKWALVEAAHTAVRRDSYFAALFHRVRKGKGKEKAYVAVARHMAKIIWKMLKEQRPYRPKPKHSQAGSGRPMAVRIGRGEADAPTV
jgi:transposase